jgi:hypothetical protein
VTRGHAAGCSGAALAKSVGLEDRCELAASYVEKRDRERRLPRDGGVRLHARVPEPAVDGRHDREGAGLQLESASRHVVDLARRHPAEAVLDDRHRLAGRDQALDVGFGQVERHAAAYERGMKLILPLPSSTPHLIWSSEVICC